MGIKNLNKRLVEIGKIKTGGKNPNKEYKGGDGLMHRNPVKFDHFVVTGLDKDNKDNFIPDPEITKELGPKPKNLDILLLSDDIDNNFMTSYAMYQGQKCACRGDGETASRRYTIDPETKKELPEPVYKDIVCNNETCDFFKPTIKKGKEIPARCKPSGVLSCMLPQTRKIGGVYKHRTTSWNSIINVTSSLEAIKLMTGGVLFGIPLRMELIDKQTEEHGKVKVVNIVYIGDIQQLQIEAGRQKQLRIDGSVSMTAQNALIRSSGIMEDRDDGADITGEFYQEPESDEPGTDGAGLSSKLNETAEKEVVKKDSDEPELF